MEPDYPIEIHANDVLCGKGNLINSHTGNKHFRSVVNHMKHEYVATPKRRKRIFAKMVLMEIRSLEPPGRFLRKNRETQQWEEIEEKEAENKARQALREGAPAIERMLECGLITVTTNYEAQWNDTQYDETT